MQEWKALQFYLFNYGFVEVLKVDPVGIYCKNVA